MRSLMRASALMGTPQVANVCDIPRPSLIETSSKEEHTEKARLTRGGRSACWVNPIPFDLCPTVNSGFRWEDLHLRPDQKNQSGGSTEILTEHSKICKISFAISKLIELLSGNLLYTNPKLQPLVQGFLQQPLFRLLSHLPAPCRLPNRLP